MAEQSASKASRAIGSMFFSVFGGAWMTLWCLDAFGVRFPILLLLTGISLVLFFLSCRQFKQNGSAHAAEADSPASKKAGRAFNIINATQWVLIFLVANGLSMFGHKEWIIPSIIFIVGVHFFPLAIIFKVPRHHITGGGMTLLAVMYPLLSKSGPANPIGCLGAGIILWASSCVALMPNPPLNSDPTCTT